MIRPPYNAFVKCFMLWLLVQQGLGSFALAAAGVFQHADGIEVAAMAHECASMMTSAEDRSESNTGVPESAQHDHQDCIDTGCDECVGCVACATGYRYSFDLYISGKPVVLAAALAAPLPAPDLLYRPPILI